IRVETPEVVTGLIGAGILGLALLASIRHRKRFPHEYEEEGDAEAILPTGQIITDAHTAGAIAPEEEEARAAPHGKPGPQAA
ncbi:MAG: hypothetical protein ABIV36_12065, partial [Sphingobium limneticum]